MAASALATLQYTNAADKTVCGVYECCERMDAVARRALHYDVVRVRNASRISIAAPSDFVCRRAAASETTTPLWPYCLDFLRARALYVAGSDAQRVQAAPFYYLHLRRQARCIVSVPIEIGTNTVAGSDPVFLFSPGRCGSTLLSRVLCEAGIASVSEPDFYTQLGSWFWSRTENPLAPIYRRAMWRMSDALVAALGPSPVVKLRAECCRAPEWLVRGPAARTVMMMRDFETWSRSTAQVFSAGPEKAVQKYLTALSCYAWLRRHSRCLLVRYEDWLSEPAAAAHQLGAFLGRPIAPEAVARALGAHSQAGTPLEGRLRPGWEAKWHAALRLWQTPRLVTARRRLDLAAFSD